MNNPGSIQLILVRGLNGVRFGNTSDYTAKRESDLLITIMITERHRTTRSPLAN